MSTTSRSAGRRKSKEDNSFTFRNWIHGKDRSGTKVPAGPFRSLNFILEATVSYLILHESGFCLDFQNSMTCGLTSLSWDARHAMQFGSSLCSLIQRSDFHCSFLFSEMPEVIICSQDFVE